MTIESGPPPEPGEAKEAPSRTQLLRDRDEMRQRLNEAEETLRAIRAGEVDALVLRGPGPTVYSLDGSDSIYRSIVEHMKEGIAVVGSAGTVLYGNENFANMLRLPREHVIGSSFDGLMAPIDRPPWLSWLKQMRAASDPGEIALMRGNGERITFHVVLMVHQEQEIDLICLMFTDVTYLKEMEKELELVRHTPATADKSAFPAEAVVERRRQPRPVPLRVLILEDQPADAELMVRQLRKVQYAPGWRRVDNERDFLAALDSVDVILADHSLPKYDSVRALQALKERGLDVPFIIVSGTIGEELGAQLMKRGAADYVWKDRMGRLGQAVIHALEQKRLRSEEKQTKYQLRLQAAALEAVANGIVITDRKGDIVWVNPAYTKITGYPLEEVLGKNPRILKSGKHDQAFYADLWKTILDHKVWRGEVVNRRKDGTLYFDEMTITAVCADGKEISHFVAIKQDVTARRRTEETLSASEAKLKAISTAALDAIIMIDSDSNVIFWNPAAEIVFACPRSEIMGKNLHDLLAPPRYRVAFERGLADFKHTGQGPVMGKLLEVFAIHRDGHEFPVEVSVAPVFLDGQWCAVGVLRDISVRKQAETALRLSEERFRNAFQFAGVPMGLTDLSGHFVQVNPACCRMLGYTEAEMLGKTYQAITHLDDVRPDLDHVRELLSGKIESYQLEKRNLHKDGSIRWVLKTASLIRGAEGRPVQILAQVQDITARKQAEGELRTLNADLETKVHDRTAQLEAANKELESFAYSVSHDLRAPLRGIDGFSQALLEDYHDKLDAEGQDSLRRVRAATQRMGRLIDDILQLSRLTRSEMNRKDVDLSAMAGCVVAELQAADPTRHDICVDITPGLTAQGDAHLLEVVLVNLLGNAWKFTSKTENGRIEFGVTESHGKGAFFVRDNGAGFDMANIDRLFGPFQRLHTEAEFPGTGIGLATVQRIIRRHGGEVWAEGAVGKGATIFFTLESTGKKQGRKNLAANGPVAAALES